jgi:coenzyme PQQ precursor peptide PqqA
MKKAWHKPVVCEQAVALEVTAYESADLDEVLF